MNPEHLKWAITFAMILFSLYRTEPIAKKNNHKILLFVSHWIAFPILVIGVAIELYLFFV